MRINDRISFAMRDALPVVLAYFPLSVTFGVLAAAGGIPWYMSLFSSVWIYSGGAQFMLLSMLEASAAPISIAATILLVNLRHVLYGASMGPNVGHWKEPLKWAGALGLTDEVFVVTSNRAGNGDTITPLYFISFAFTAYGSWIAGTAAGAAIGSIVPESVAAVLSFALPALFLALLFAGERTFPHLLSACTGALIATIASILGGSGVGLIAGSLIGATVGMMIGRNVLTKSNKNMTGKRKEN